MINHMVFLEFKSETPQKEIEEMLSQLGDLKNLIPNILSFSFGKNSSPEGLNQGFTHAFLMQFDTAAGREIYLQHPEHIRIASELIVPALKQGIQSALVVDYEFS